MSSREMSSGKGRRSYGSGKERVPIAAVVVVVAMFGGVVVAGCDAHSAGGERARGEHSGRVESTRSAEGGSGRDGRTRETATPDAGTATVDTGRGRAGETDEVARSRRDAALNGTMEACRAARPDGEIELDLDGDGQLDTATFVTSTGGGGERVVLRVSLANGRDVRLGTPGDSALTRRFYGESGGSRYRDDFDFVCAWGVRESSDGRITGGPGIPGATGWEIEEALGDGLYLTGTDAAALVYLAEEGWIFMGLGF